MSLKQCGLEDRIPAYGGNVSINMAIPNDFLWHAAPLRQLRIAHVLELLRFILVTASTKVMMHPHEYLNHVTSIEFVHLVKKCVL